MHFDPHQSYHDRAECFGRIRSLDKGVSTERDNSVDCQRALASERANNNVTRWYALTMHEQGGERVMGYDNAHAVKPPGKYKYAGQILQYDHKHRHIADKGAPYKFKDSYQLLQDFFADVDRILKEIEL